MHYKQTVFLTQSSKIVQFKKDNKVSISRIPRNTVAGK